DVGGMSQPEADPLAPTSVPANGHDSLRHEDEDQRLVHVEAPLHSARAALRVDGVGDPPPGPLHETWVGQVLLERPRGARACQAPGHNAVRLVELDVHGRAAYELGVDRLGVAKAVAVGRKALPAWLAGVDPGVRSLARVGGRTLDARQGG